MQTGDQLDRGDGERAILDLLDRLSEEAKTAGGAVIALDGNHEVMNVALDFRYVTRAASRTSRGCPARSRAIRACLALPPAARARAAAFLPGAPMAKKLARRGIVAVVGDTVFVHGGVLPKHVRYGLESNEPRGKRLDGRARGGAAGDRDRRGRAHLDPPLLRRACRGRLPGTPRGAGADPGEAHGRRSHRAARGDQRGVRGAGVAVDVGLSRVYGGKPEVLEITGDRARALKTP